MLRLPRTFADSIVAQARAEFPNEACGLIAGRFDGSDGVAKRLYPMTNAERSPVIYRMDPQEQLRVFNEMEREELELVGIYHSHTRSAAYPSTTDVALAYYPDSTYLIVSLADTEAPDLRAWKIADGRIEELELSYE